ncbi:MAG: CinA family nicotinamide mononucleotide deamidase-related protein [Planctomycetota bacterium]
MRLGSAAILVVFVVLVALPLLLAPRRAAPPDGARLIIITPHNEQIRYEFSRAFAAWHADRFGARVHVEWSVPGGTSEILRMLRSQYAAAADAGDPLGGRADLMWGGGSWVHEQLKRPAVPITAPIDFDDGWLESVYGDNRIGDARLYDPLKHWFGTALAAFGIVYNRDVLAELGVAEPRTWADLADPRLEGWVAMADPAHSGSITTLFETILRQRGWEEGWWILRRAGANARGFSASALKSPVDVSLGDAAAGLCIDFFGRYQAQAIKSAGGRRRIGYIDPAGETSIDADPISMLGGAPRPDLARRFIEFCLSEPGQSLWQFPVGEATVRGDGHRQPPAAAGGLEDHQRHGRRRPPARPDAGAVRCHAPGVGNAVTTGAAPHLSGQLRADRGPGIDCGVRAAIVSIGDELVAGQAPESNARWLADRLSARAVTIEELRVVPDDRAAIAGALQRLARRCDLIVVTGGLGPTVDDLTRDALGDLLAPGRDLLVDDEQQALLRQRFEKLGIPMPDSNLVQVRHPEGTRMLANRRGTAPGLAGRLGDCLVYCLPGPPHEMQAMFDRQVLGELSLTDQWVRLTGLVHAYGLPEADAGERLGRIADRDRTPRVGITVSDAILTARIQAEGAPQDARRQVAHTRALIRQRWSPFVYGDDGQTLAEAVGARLTETGRTVATAESCTGGWLSRLIVDVAGSSDYFIGGWVTYSNQLKTSCLDVPQSLIVEHGAVSEAVARAMARGALAASGADEGLAITGIAGPGGGTADKPVGTVFIGLARRLEDRVAVSARQFRFSGDRTTVRDRSAKSALQLLRFALCDVPADVPLLWEPRTP